MDEKERFKARLATPEDKAKKQKKDIEKMAIELYFLKSAIEENIKSLKHRANSFGNIGKGKEIKTEINGLLIEIQTDIATAIADVRDRFSSMRISNKPLDKVDDDDIGGFRSYFLEILEDPDKAMRDKEAEAKQAISSDMNFVESLIEPSKTDSGIGVRVDIDLGHENQKEYLKKLLKANGALVHLALDNKWSQVENRITALENNQKELHEYEEKKLKEKMAKKEKVVKKALLIFNLIAAITEQLATYSGNRIIKSSRARQVQTELTSLRNKLQEGLKKYVSEIRRNYKLLNSVSFINKDRDGKTIKLSDYDFNIINYQLILTGNHEFSELTKQSIKTHDELKKLFDNIGESCFSDYFGFAKLSSLTGGFDESEIPVLEADYEKISEQIFQFLLSDEWRDGIDKSEQIEEEEKKYRVKEIAWTLLTDFHKSDKSIEDLITGIEKMVNHKDIEGLNQDQLRNFLELHNLKKELEECRKKIASDFDAFRFKGKPLHTIDLSELTDADKKDIVDKIEIETQSNIYELAKTLTSNRYNITELDIKIREKIKLLDNIYQSFLQMVENPPTRIGDKARSPYELSRIGLYSMWAGERKVKEWKGYVPEDITMKTPLFIYENEGLKYLYSHALDNPIVIRDAKDQEYFQKGLFDLKDGDFCNEYGCKLPDKLAKHPADVFHQAMVGVEILPRPKEKRGYAVKREFRGGGTGEKLKPRHWGQMFLATPAENMKPDDVIVGQLLGSGGSYKAYIFGDKTVVEFDHEKHGTYLFDTAYFKNLKNWSRSKLVETKPDGFHGRIIHNKNNREWWKSRISDFLRKKPSGSSHSFDQEQQSA